VALGKGGKGTTTQDQNKRAAEPIEQEGEGFPPEESSATVEVHYSNFIVPAPEQCGGKHMYSADPCRVKGGSADRGAPKTPQLLREVFADLPTPASGRKKISDKK
jgi:hypothetical protein